jgi:hypothetical protein
MSVSYLPKEDAKAVAEVRLGGGFCHYAVGRFAADLPP